MDILMKRVKYDYFSSCQNSQGITYCSSKFFSEMAEFSDYTIWELVVTLIQDMHVSGFLH